MANCIRHERCPVCAKHGRDRSGNNLGIYDDGSSYCFAGHGVHNGSIYMLSLERQGMRETGKNLLEGSSPRLPEDSKSIEGFDEGVDWLLRYDLTPREISDNLLLFSKKGIYLERKDENVFPLIIFPIYGEGNNLLLWTGRNLSYQGTGTKWVIKGKPSEVIHGIYPTERFLSLQSCCVCEDIISAIKLGRIIPTYPLFGKNISERLLTYLASNFRELLLYLDFDAIDTMVELKSKCEPYFDSIRIIISQNDPKEYNTEQLREIIK